MDRINAYLAAHRDDSWSNFLSLAGIVLSLAAAGLLLMWFVAVLDDVTERGDQRRLQQRTSGSLLLPDELQARVAAGSLQVRAANGDVPGMR